jgi:hypothetical protein
MVFEIAIRYLFGIVSRRSRERNFLRRSDAGSFDAIICLPDRQTHAFLQR